ncbi:MAG: galactose mutarotase-like enzyme [Arcticibacterium sp.]|jgi:galactose mutarotase-like enzyme
MVPLPEVLSDAKHGDHFHFEWVTCTVTLEDGGEGKDIRIHGEIAAFDKKTWMAEEIKRLLESSLSSIDYQNNFPGNLVVKVIFNLTDHNALLIKYEADRDKDTPISLTNHSYETVLQRSHFFICLLFVCCFLTRS